MNEGEKNKQCVHFDAVNAVVFGWCCLRSCRTLTCVERTLRVACSATSGVHGEKLCGICQSLYSSSV